MVNIPQFKKDICAFLRSEDGKISKESILKTSIALTLMASSVLVKPVNAAVSCTPDCGLGPGVADQASQVTSSPIDKTLPGSHDNQLSLAWQTSGATGSHMHCQQSCHVSHANHADSHCDCNDPTFN